MFSFLISVLMLILGYIFYGNFIDKTFGPTDEQTPAYKINDGVDFVPMPVWKVWLIQLLNIAGNGPIFGAISGALFGPIVYLWIVLGCIFGGAVHDYMSGMLSIKNNGASIPEITGIYLGNKAKIFMRIFSFILLILCAVVFTIGPAGLLAKITPEEYNTNFWFWVIIIYFFIATFVPIDKIIGKFYPIFGACLMLMALGVSISLLISDKFVMPEVWNTFNNLHPNNLPVWPFMFITVACGAISGFHATQSPMMARCITSERSSRKVFFGAMVAEGIIALVWAAAGVSCFENTQALLTAGGGNSNVVYIICTTTMGNLGAILALLGVIACPITSGDTAYRAARLIIADSLNLDQSNWKKRFAVTLPILMIGYFIGQIDYSVIWRYFSWANQTLAMIVMWVSAVFLANNKKNFWVALLPAMFMTVLTVTYFFTAPECFGLILKNLDKSSFWVKNNYIISVSIGIIVNIICSYLFFKRIKK